MTKKKEKSSYRRKYVFYQSQLVTFCEKFKEEFENYSSAAVVEVKKAELERRWVSVVESFDQVMTSGDADETRNFDEDSCKFEEATEIYQECKIKVLEATTVNSVINQRENTQAATIVAHQGASNLKLPACDTPPFEGGYSNWPAFRDIFQAVFINHTGLSEAQKLYHLRSKTRGEALQIVQRFDLVDTNFKLAWEALKERYENKRILVHQQMKKFYGMQNAPCETPKAIRQIRTTINDSMAIFNSYDIETTNWDPMLVHWCSSKLPEETLRAWEDSLSNHKELPTWPQLDAFLAKRIEILETLTDFKKPSQKENTNSKSQAFYSKTETEKAEKGQKCKKCSQDHPIRHCKEFKAMTPTERIKFVYTNKYCANCLSPRHFKPNCSSTKTCARCHRKHHTLLHCEKTVTNSTNYRTNDNRNRDNMEDERPSTSGLQSSAPSFHPGRNSVPYEAVQSHLAQNSGTTVLPTALVEMKHAGENFLVRALLDAGSEKSFISKRMQQQLRLPIERHNTQISGLGGTVVGNSQGKCYVEIKSRHSDFSLKMSAIIVLKLAHLLPAKRINVNKIGDLSHLHLADPYFYKPSQIDMIIGSDYLPLINMEGVRLDIARGVEARESKLGWYLSGPMPAGDVNTFSTIVHECDDTVLHEQMKKFWEIEEVEKCSSVSESDAYCEEFYKKTTFRQADGRYVVRLPFRSEFPQEIYLGASKNIATAQYLRMEKTLEKSKLKEVYCNVLQEYIDLDHMEHVVHHDPSNEKHSSFFLPHHAVVKPDSTSTKVRVVFNGSSKTTSGFSLNHVLHSGPTLLANLTQIILKWRFYEYVFTGDIQKMYRQIWIHPEDRKYQRIVFRPHAAGGLKTYQLKTVTFGINCAPFLALRTLIQISEDCKNSNEKVSDIIRHETYVDDVLSGGYTIEEANEKQIELKKTLMAAGFPLKKITANNEALLQTLAREDLLDEDFLKFDESSTTKTLGIRWNARTDTFFYNVEKICIPATITKRNILSVIAKLYDPLGWLGPIIIMAKTLMQSLWQEKVDWDEPVPLHLLNDWTTFMENFPHIANIKIPRWVGFTQGLELQVHGFCDASEKAYCGAIYLRVGSLPGEISSHLLVAKTRVAPLKSITIPKMELCGAVLMSKLMSSLDIRGSYETFLWTDSSIVLGWLQKPPQTLKTFVSNRIMEINRISDVQSWRHVKSEDNPADLGTRGCTPQELVQHSLWWHGPPWLQQPAEHWPKPRTFDPTDLETKKISTFFLDVQNEEITCRFSSLNRAIRVVCQIFRFFRRCRKEPPPEHEPLSATEILFAKNRLISLAQKSYYPQDYEKLHVNTPLSKRSSLLTLSPFLDESGLIRVGGRLDNSGLSFNERHPVLIPDKSHFALLFIKYTHDILLHAEHHIMIRAIRQGFYLPRLRNAIRKCIKGCRVCTIYKQKVQGQLMASLPPERVTFSLPFTYTGVDFAGPFSIKSSTLRNAKLVKGYAAVFVCFSTRAVHLETCSDLSAEAFLAVFARFVGRRGLPKTLFSDNGRNFVGANRKLLQDHAKFLQSIGDNLVGKYSAQGFTWSFIPPYAPHIGGLWEAAVKSMKSHLKKITYKLNFTFEEFTTLLVRIEAVLNSRPLCPTSEDPSEILPLTPGHFLRGAPLTAPPEPLASSKTNSLSYINRWQRLSILLHNFSQRWKAEYVTELQRRYKWKTSKNNVQEGDFVIVKEDSLPPTEWCLGRITKVFRGKDDNVRVAEVKTNHGLIIRPIVKLCLLPSSAPPALPITTSEN